MPGYRQAARDRDEAKRNRGSAGAEAVRKPVPEEGQAARDRDEAKRNRGSAGQVRRRQSENLYRKKGRPPATEMKRSGIEVPRAGQAEAVRKPVPEEQAARDRDEAKRNRGSAGQVRRTKAILRESSKQKRK